METPNRYRSWFIGLSLGVLLALGIWPMSRWLVRTQFTLALPVNQFLGPWNFTPNVTGKNRADRDASQAAHATAVAHPDDFRVQVADALTNLPANEPLSSTIKIERLRHLTTLFPDRPSLYANILRFAAQGPVHIHRDELDMFATTPPLRPGSMLSGTADTSKGWHGIPRKAVSEQTGKKPDATADTSKPLADFDRDAAEGERLDPNNAYFPLMRAVGLFAGHRDTEALEAVQRAAQKTEWNEYYDDELEGEWRLQEETFGQNGALPRTAFAAGLLFPQYAQMRAVGRMAIVKAIEAEQAGRGGEGLAIRDAVRHIGALVRAESRSVIGNLVGIAIVKVALMRPAGAPLIAEPHAKLIAEPHAKEEERYREQLLQEFDVHLQRIGHFEESAEIHREIMADAQAREIIFYTQDHGLFGKELPWLIIWWTVDMILLSCALWTLGLGGVATLLGRHPRIRTGNGLPLYARRGAAFGLMTAMLIGSALLLDIRLDGMPMASQLYRAGILVLVILNIALPGLSGVDRLRSMGVFCLGLFFPLLLGAGFAWQAQGSIERITQFLQYFAVEGNIPSELPVWPVAIAASIPLLTLLTFAILSLAWRVPLTVGMVRGLRGSAAPIACALLLLYSALLPLTLRQESLVDESMKHSLQHEGRFLSNLIGKEWPGRIP